MRLVFRKVSTTYSTEEVLRIIKSLNSRYYAWRANHNTFSILYPVRWHRQLSLIPVCGTIKEQANYTEVTIEIHGGLVFYIGLLFVAIGVLIAVYSRAINAPNLYSSLCCFGVGVFMYVFSVFDGIMCLDSLEHRLTRGQQKTGDGSLSSEETE